MRAPYLNSGGAIERQEVLKEVMVCLWEREEKWLEVNSRENRREQKGELTKGKGFQSQRGVHVG